MDLRNQVFVQPLVALNLVSLPHSRRIVIWRRLCVHRRASHYGKVTLRRRVKRRWKRVPSVRPLLRSRRRDHNHRWICVLRMRCVHHRLPLWFVAPAADSDDEQAGGNCRPHATYRTRQHCQCLVAQAVTDDDCQRHRESDRCQPCKDFQSLPTLSRFFCSSIFTSLP